MQKLLLAALSEPHRVRTEIEVVLPALASLRFLILNVDPALLVVPALAHGVLVLHRVQVDLVTLAGLLGLVQGSTHDLLIHNLFASVVDLLGYQEHLLRAPVLVPTADLHVVEHCCLFALHFHFIDQLEEDAAVLLDGCIGDIELAFDLVLLNCVRQFILSKHIEDLALEHVLIGEFEFLCPIDFCLFFPEFDLAFGQFVSSPLHVDFELSVFSDLRQVLGGVDQLHRTVERMQYCLLDVLGLVKPVGTNHGHCGVVLSVLLLGRKLTRVEADNHAVLQFVGPVLLQGGHKLGHLVVHLPFLGLLDFLHEGVGLAGQQAGFALDLPHGRHGRLNLGLGPQSGSHSDGPVVNL